MRNWLKYVVVFVFLLSLVGCRSEAEPPMRDEAATLDVVVSIVPQRYFVERLGGEYVHVTVLVPPGADPHTYEPKPSQMQALSQADIYFRIGGHFEEAWVERIAALNPDMLIVDTSEGISPFESLEEAHEGNHDLEDPHIWLSPRLVKVQVQTMHRVLVERDPVHKATYDANFQAFIADIDALDAEIRQTLEGLHTRKFIVFHPAWGYFAKEYGLEQVPIEIGGLEPGPADLERVIRVAREEGIRLILAQPELSTQAAETVAREINGHVVLISPLAPDWLENMRQIAAALAEVSE